MTNQLVNETSPYLLQHADNPVDWYPWGDEALQLAKEMDKPILLSIGYAACHWCHVMAHESFEDEETAAIMNQYFINIKVDREERPDLDSIYMGAVQALTGQGGWPMTVFLTPEGKPFYGGTYYPPVPRYGMPSFQQLLNSIAQSWTTKRDEIENSASGIADHLSGSVIPVRGEEMFDAGIFSQALRKIFSKFDAQEGGFSAAPKFPPSMTIEFLLRVNVQRNDGMALHMAELTLDKMAYSGMYDQLGGGFARYATDEHWLIPHFEKMLYDNALLSRTYLHAFQLTGKPLYRRIVQETLDFVMRDMRHVQGGFFSSYDADSEGEEGKFYVWSAEEIRDLLGDQADLFMRYYDVSAAGNWEGHNILNIAEEPATIAAEFRLTQSELEKHLFEMRQILLQARTQRVWPGLDDKVLSAWNGLMLASFAEAGRVLKRDDYVQIAVQNAQFLYEIMRQEDGRLLRTWKEGSPAKYNAYLEDYAYLADGLLALYQATFDERWFKWAEELVEQIIERFSDEANGGFFDTSSDHEQLLFRPKDIQDNATPSANSMVAHVLLKISLYTGNGDYWDIAERMVDGLSTILTQYPTGFAHWLCAAAFILGTPQELAIAGDSTHPDTQALLDIVDATYRPNLVVAVGDRSSSIPLLAERPMIDNKSTAYLCRRFVCHAPLTEAEELQEQLD
ncbi:MAG: thioredoxin domain-containing protein [Candidatus Promineifilaceae bacterium]|nr:thioredoxin domain-containing protein [Candidatus Promineifilaceae bacterium]